MDELRVKLTVEGMEYNMVSHLAEMSKEINEIISKKVSEFDLEKLIGEEIESRLKSNIAHFVNLAIEKIVLEKARESDFIASIQYKLPMCFKMEYIWEMAEKRNQTLRYDYAFASSYELYKALQDFNYKITTTQYGELIFTADNGNS